MEREVIFSKKVEHYLDELMFEKESLTKPTKTSWYIFYQERNNIYSCFHLCNLYIYFTIQLQVFIIASVVDVGFG